MLSVPCQALLYFPTVNKDKQTDGHHLSGCKDKAFGLLLHLFYKGIPSIPKNFPVRSRLHLLGRQIHNQQYKKKGRPPSPHIIPQIFATMPKL